MYAYNHAGWYVAQVGQLAQHYAQTADTAVLATGAPPAGCVTSGPSTPGSTARILPDGLAVVPEGAPVQVQAAIAAGNRIIDTSYSTERQPNMLSTVMGSYDCSGSTDFVLHNAGLTSPQVDAGNRIAGDSTLLETYGSPGPGHWITVYASPNPFIQIAGIVLDTAHWTPTTPPGSGPRWQGHINPRQPVERRRQLDRATPPRTMRRPSPRVLKRSLLAAVGVLTIASTAVQPATTRVAKHPIRLPPPKSESKSPTTARSTFAARPLRAHRHRADSLERQN